MSEGNCYQKILCHVHEEKTPSLALYTDGKYFCFGCGVTGVISDLGIEARIEEKVKEDISHTLRYIDELPLKSIRGLELPTDGKFYYIKFPNEDYFKKRRVFDESHGRYVSPRGHAKPLFTASLNPAHTTLLIVEGEINALSAMQCNIPIDIVSPGACVNFTLKELKPLISRLREYSAIIIVVDMDVPGVSAAMKLKAELYKVNPNIKVEGVYEDFNDTLVKNGKEALESKIKSYLDVQTRV